MTYRLVLASRVAGDIDRLQDFLVADSPEAAENAVAKIYESLASLRQFPFRTRDRGGGRHELVISFGRAAYIARYRVVERHVLLTRIFHSRERR